MKEILMDVVVMWGIVLLLMVSVGLYRIVLGSTGGALFGRWKQVEWH